MTAGEGYRVAMPPSGYSWGSNSNLLNNALVMAYAYRLTGDAALPDAVVETMDYVLGRNGLNFSFVSGYGTYAMQHPHHRFWADQPESRLSAGAAGGAGGRPQCPSRRSRRAGAGDRHARRLRSATSTTSGRIRPTRSPSTGTRRWRGSRPSSTQQNSLN